MTEILTAPRRETTIPVAQGDRGAIEGWFMGKLGPGSSKQRDFEELRRAWLDGREIVPLFGAGISVPAAIPTTAQIIDYLVQVRYLAELDGWLDSGDYVSLRGWPGRHQLQVDLQIKHRVLGTKPGESLTEALKRTRAEATAAAISSELGREHPTVARVLQKLSHGRSDLLFVHEWSPLLQLVAGRRESLVDMFFDRVIRGRRPTMGHRFIAHMAKFIGWSPILTTNFDDLIETALRDEGLSPVVYELVKGHKVPDARLVRSHLSVVKIHGGSFGLRTGLELNDPIDEHTALFFEQCLPRDAVLLVVGYGGADLRMRTLIDFVARDSGLGRKVVWVYRSRPPDLPKSLDRRLRFVETTDGGLFLQELYTRFSLSHAVGQHPYPALSSVPEITRRLAVENGPASGATSSAHPADTQRRKLLKTFNHEANSGHVKLWFNLYDLDSLGTMLTRIAELIRTYDRSFPRRALSSALMLRGNPDDADFAERVKPWCVRMASALRRGNYMIGVDGIRAFSNSHPAWISGREEARSAVEQKRLLTFLKALSSVASEDDGEKTDARIHPMPRGLGDSKIALVLEHDSVSRDETPPDLAPMQVFWAQQPASADAPALLELAAERRREDPVWAAAIDAAVSFRRPRSIVGLIRVAWRVLKLREQLTPRALRGEQELPGADLPTSSDMRRVTGELGSVYHRLEQAVAELGNEGFLEPLDGGFYAMAYGVRNALYQMIPEGERHQIQHYVADYYNVMLYEQSRDLGAYREYVFHRLASIHQLPSGTKPGSTLRARRLRWLLGSLRRERTYLLARGHASAILGMLHQLNSFLEEHSAGDGAFAEAKDQVREMEAAIWEDLTDYRWCEAHYREVLHQRLCRLEETSSSDERPELTPGALLTRMSAVGELVRRHPWMGIGIAEAAMEFATALSASRVARVAGDPQLSNADALIEGALQIVDEVREVVPENPAAAPPASTVDELHLRAIAARMDARLRQGNLWTGSQWTPADHKDVMSWFQDAKELLRKRGQSLLNRRMQTRLRCLVARSLVLTGSFGKANEELNRAHAFASRSREPEALLNLAIYQLHRAEYCLSFAVGDNARELTAQERRWLLDASRTALDQAEWLLNDGGQGIFWWGRLFILQARLGIELLQSMIADVQRREVQHTDVLDLEEQMVRALHSIAGGLANIYENDQREALLDDLWDQLEDAHHAFCDLLGDRAQTRQREPTTWERWRMLNARAGLYWYFEARKNRIPVLDATARVHGSTGKVRDCSDRSVKVEFAGKVNVTTGQECRVQLTVAGVDIEMLDSRVVSNSDVAAGCVVIVRFKRPGFSQRLTIRTVVREARKNR